MADFYLNSDKSIMGDISKNGKLIISSNHSSKKNSEKLVANILDNITIENNKDKYIIKLKDVPFVVKNKKTGKVRSEERRVGKEV